MKILRKHLITSLTVFGVLLIYSGRCHSKPVDNQNLLRTAPSDTIPSQSAGNQQPIISNSLYFSIEDLYSGPVWRDEDGTGFFYRILLCSVEEEKYIYVELISFPAEEGPWKLVKREKIESDIFGFVYYSDYPKMIKWISSDKVELEINHEMFIYDITSRTSSRVAKPLK